MDFTKEDIEKYIEKRNKLERQLQDERVFGDGSKTTFKDNESYFEFYNKMKDVINITSVKVLEDKIKIEYEDKEVK